MARRVTYLEKWDKYLAGEERRLELERQLELALFRVKQLEKQVEYAEQLLAERRKEGA